MLSSTRSYAAVPVNLDYASKMMRHEDSGRAREDGGQVDVA